MKISVRASRSQAARDKTIATFGARARRLARAEQAEALLLACITSLEGYRRNEHGEGCGQMCDAEKAARAFLGLRDSMWELYGGGRKVSIGEGFAYWAWVRSEHPAACIGPDPKPTFFMSWNCGELTKPESYR